MPGTSVETIQKLNDVEALAAAQSLVVLLDLQLQQAADTGRPANIDVGDQQALVNSSDQAGELAGALQGASTVETAAAARVLLLACLQMGYEEEVAGACESADTHVLDMGIVSGALLVAGLATVVAWVPYDKKTRVRENTTVRADGTIIATKEIDEEVKRVGKGALEALKSWWTAVFT